jgi:hypothetical protein
MLTDSQLEQLCQKMEIPLEGVYFKDELPRKLTYNKSYIINLENSVDENGDPNDGSHWTCLQVNKYPNGQIEPIFFDPYGVAPSESIKKFVLDNCGKRLPYTTSDLQSLMANCCGYFVCAFLHYINASQYRSRDFYNDVAYFMDCFDDLNKSMDWKKNEYILKLFFRAKDPALRREIEVIASPDTLDRDDENVRRGDILKIPVTTEMMS